MEGDWQIFNLWRSNKTYPMQRRLYTEVERQDTEPNTVNARRTIPPRGESRIDTTLFGVFFMPISQLCVFVSYSHHV